jgi:hypothetical protein
MALRDALGEENALLDDSMNSLSTSQNGADSSLCF